MARMSDRLKHAWNAFTQPEKKEDETQPASYGVASSYSPGRVRYRYSYDKNFITPLYNQMAVDAAAIDIKHVRTDDKDRYLKTIKSGLNECLNVTANIDQGARAFRQDIYMTMFEEGHCAIVPIDTSLAPLDTGGYDILSMRVGRVTEWFPRHVRVSVYDDREQYGVRREIVLPKSVVAIVENPHYSTMNEPNSTLQRLLRKLAMLDSIDEQTSSGKLDLIIQLPYVIKTEAKRAEADRRRGEIETQLKGSKYGIAYTDGTEKITQLNRPAENTLLGQIKDLREDLYGQLGITKEIFDGTADESAMKNYLAKTIKPVVESTAEAMASTFLTKTARTQLQTLDYFIDPFELVPVSDIAEIADKFTRNEILSANEIRSAIGYIPSEDPKADQLRNSNMPQPNEEPL